MQTPLGTGWQVALYGCGAMCLGITLALGVGLAAMAARLRPRQHQLLSAISVLLLTLGTLLFALAMA